MFVEKENQYKIEHEVKHSGGFGIFALAVAIVVAALIIHPGASRIDCFLDVEAACAQIAETYK